MSEDKFIKIQHQMRQNQADLHDYLRDLDNWSEEIKVKDETLKLQEDPKKSKQEKLPPVRNSLEKKKKKKKKRPKEETKQKTKKISGYDFRAWDKFDVDGALQEIDADDEKAKTSSGEETDEEWEAERYKQQAIMLKDQGNQYFKEKRYNEAIECYTRAMNCDPTNVVLPANRAMALLKQDKFGSAELDCTTAIALDPTFVKAYHRRGTARVGLNKLQEAKHDFLQVLKLEGTNKVARAEIDKIDKAIFYETSGVTEESGLVKAISKPLNKRSQKPLRRISIEEIGEDPDEERKKAVQEITKTHSQAKQKIVKDDQELFEKFTKSESKPCTKGTEEKSFVTEIVEEDMKLDLESVKQEDKEPPAVIFDKTQAKKSFQTEAVRSPSGSVQSTPTTSPRVPPLPTSSFQFQANWKELQNHDEQFYQYFKQIEPKSYPKLFGEALDADILTKVMIILKNYYLRDGIDIFPVLQSLTGVHRFSMTVMFFSSKEKQVIKELFSSVRTDAKYDSAAINSLAKKYEI